MAANKKEVVAELKHVAWQLEHGLDLTSDWVKLNFGERHVKFEGYDKVKVNVKEFFARLFGGVK